MEVVAEAADVCADEQVIDGEPVVVASEAHAAGGVGLWVAVDEEGWEAFLGEGGSEIDSGGGLSDAALLVYDGDDFAGSGLGLRLARGFDLRLCRRVNWSRRGCRG